MKRATLLGESEFVGRMVKVKNPLLIELEKMTFPEFHYLWTLSKMLGVIKRVYYSEENAFIFDVDFYDDNNILQFYVHEVDVEVIQKDREIAILWKYPYEVRRQFI